MRLYALTIDTPVNERVVCRYVSAIRVTSASFRGPRRASFATRNYHSRRGLTLSGLASCSPSAMPHSRWASAAASISSPTHLHASFTPPVLLPPALRKKDARSEMILIPDGRRPSCRNPAVRFRATRCPMQQYTRTNEKDKPPTDRGIISRRTNGNDLFTFPRDLVNRAINTFPIDVDTSLLNFKECEFEDKALENSRPTN